MESLLQNIFFMQLMSIDCACPVSSASGVLSILTKLWANTYKSELGSSCSLLNCKQLSLVLASGRSSCGPRLLLTLVCISRGNTVAKLMFKPQTYYNNNRKSYSGCLSNHARESRSSALNLWISNWLSGMSLWRLPWIAAQLCRQNSYTCSEEMPVIFCWQVRLSSSWGKQNTYCCL